MLFSTDFQWHSLWVLGNLELQTCWVYRQIVNSHLWKNRVREHAAQGPATDAISGWIYMKHGRILVWHGHGISRLYSGSWRHTAKLNSHSTTLLYFFELFWHYTFGEPAFMPGLTVGPCVLCRCWLTRAHWYNSQFPCPWWH